MEISSHLLFSWIKLFISFVLIAGVQGSAHDDKVEEESVSGLHAAVVAVFFVCLICLLALCTEQVEPIRPVPSWVNTIQIDPALMNEGFSGCSDGINIVNPQCVQRTRTGHFETDGARWSVAFTKGKHVFEVHWPTAVRGTLASIGVGTEDAPLMVKPRDSLVGCNKQTWGLDLARRRVLHGGQIICNFPPGGTMVPDKFYVYLDCDSHTVGFGTEVNYWGAPISVPANKFPVHLMVGILHAGSQVTVIYRGSAVAANQMPQTITNTVVVPSQVPGNPGYTTVTVVNPNTVQTQHQGQLYPQLQANPQQQEYPPQQQEYPPQQQEYPPQQQGYPAQDPSVVPSAPEDEEKKSP